MGFNRELLIRVVIVRLSHRDFDPLINDRQVTHMLGNVGDYGRREALEHHQWKRCGSSLCLSSFDPAQSRRSGLSRSQTGMGPFHLTS